MSRDDGFAVMDVSTDIVNDPKFRRLHRQNPEHVIAGFLAYVATMGESWKAGRRVPVADAWPVILPYDEAVIGSMVASELLDAKGLIPAKTWSGWFGPAQKRRKATRDRWRRANEKRGAENTNNSAQSAPEPRGNSADTGAIPSVPSVSQSVPSDPSVPPVSSAYPEGDRDCLDTYHDLTMFQPWGKWPGDKLKGAITEYGDAVVDAALRAEHSGDPDRKTLLDRTLARLARDADRAKEAKKAAPKPHRNGQTPEQLAAYEDTRRRLAAGEVL
jgi:hypothetical protein